VVVNTVDNIQTVFNEKSVSSSISCIISTSAILVEKSVKLFLIKLKYENPNFEVVFNTVKTIVFKMLIYYNNFTHCLCNKVFLVVAQDDQI